MAKFSEKVLAKLARKRIERDEVELVLADPERGPEPSRARGSDRMIYSRRVGKTRVLLVFVEPYDHEEVVTAYYAPPPRKRRRRNA